MFAPRAKRSSQNRVPDRERVQIYHLFARWCLHTKRPGRLAAATAAAASDPIGVPPSAARRLTKWVAQSFAVPMCRTHLVARRQSHYRWRPGEPARFAASWGEARAARPHEQPADHCRARLRGAQGGLAARLIGRRRLSSP